MRVIKIAGIQAFSVPAIQESDKLVEDKRKLGLVVKSFVARVEFRGVYDTRYQELARFLLEQYVLPHKLRSQELTIAQTKKKLVLIYQVS